MPSSLAGQLVQAAAALDESRTPLALIGGMALASRGVMRGTRDIIRALLRANRDSLDLAEVREYFRLFDRESQLDELLEQAG